ncbi:MAG: asparagine synthase-related protein [Parvularculaceae bacterium]
MRPPLLDHKLVEWAGAFRRAISSTAGAGKRSPKAALDAAPWRRVLARRETFRSAADALDALTLRTIRSGVSNASRAWSESGLFDERAVKAMMRAHLPAAPDCAQELWTIIMFDAFLRNGR